jgi:preprotein translocase subunit SecG
MPDVPPWIDLAIDILTKLTVTVGLGLLVMALVLNVIRSGRSEDKRFAEYAAQRDAREALVVRERDEWKAIADKREARADAADDRTERAVKAFETAYGILAKAAHRGQLLPPDEP